MPFLFSLKNRGLTMCPLGLLAITSAAFNLASLMHSLRPDSLYFAGAPSGIDSAEQLVVASSLIVFRSVFHCCVTVFSIAFYLLDL